jgi:hypothetical protein
VVCSISSYEFPIPDGSNREFIRSFGIFPVICVNKELDIRYFTSI